MNIKKLHVVFALTALFLFASSGSAFASDDDNPLIDPFIGFGLGIANYDFYNCQSENGGSDCGVSPNLNDSAFLFKGGFYYSHWRKATKLDIGWEMEWYQSTGMHIHKAGEIDDRVLTLRLLARLPMLISEDHPDGRFQPYAGIGIGSDILRVVPKDPSYGKSMDCNHGTTDFLLGAKYFVTRHSAVFVESRVFYTSHRDTNDVRPDISFEQRTASLILGLAYHI